MQSVFPSQGSNGHYTIKRVTCSSDGSIVIVHFAAGPTYRSTNFGVSFAVMGIFIGNGQAVVNSLTYCAGTAYCGVDDTIEVAMTPTGSTVVVANPGGYVWISSNSGASFTATLTSFAQNWNALSVSADGQTIVAGQFGNEFLQNGAGSWSPNPNPNYIYVSHDGGGTWASVFISAGANWYASRMSANGTVVTMSSTGADAHTYLSIDSGVTWSAILPQLSLTHSVVMSADGTRLAARGVDDNLYTSTNTGVSWINRGPSSGCAPQAASSDLSRLVAFCPGANSMTDLYTSP